MVLQPAYASAIWKISFSIVVYQDHVGTLLNYFNSTETGKNLAEKKIKQITSIVTKRMMNTKFKLIFNFTCAATDLPHPDDMLTTTPCLLSTIRGMKWRNIFAIPFKFVSMTASNSSAGTSHSLLFLLIVPALFTADTLL